jgi:RNA polymerase sigma factor (sigma-70 family)
LDALVRGCRPLIAGTARNCLANPADVDDVVQEVSLKLVLHFERLHSPDAVGGWLKRVTTNEAILVGRRCRRTVICDTWDDLAAEDCTEESALRGTIGGDIGGVMQRALQLLRTDERLMVGLLFASDSPNYLEISRQTGRPVGSIGPTRQRLLGRLRHDRTLLPLGA